MFDHQNSRIKGSQRRMQLSLALALVGGGASAFQHGSSGMRGSSALQAQTNVAIVGCGLPARGMGWFHGLQLVEGECESARLSDVVRFQRRSFGDCVRSLCS